ncbi:hypothetical protein RNJ44_04844 [Nakaseomyces bracarensis]|uniref:Uncharacterized protein n=1 Tax=Nakaseomyces bracarensis TaxID=273131 RepID=A0ABR4NW58_9SACH
MPLSASGYGTTHKIREQLDFTDEIKWKQFSSRRLELIDKFELSKHKASEQDDNIKQIANMLRIEFEFPVEATQGFEKLVTAAVQSVRRNRKRSKKKTPSSSTTKKVRKPMTPTGTRSQSENVSGRSRSNSSSSSSSSISSVSTAVATNSNGGSNHTTQNGDAQSVPPPTQGQISRVNTPTSIASPPSTISLPYHHSVLSPPNNSFQNAVQNILLPLPTSLKKSNLLSNSNESQQPKPQKPATDEDVAKSIISDLIILPVIHNKAFIELVKNSETCKSIVSKSDSQNTSTSSPSTAVTFFATFANIEILGEMAIKFSISFSVENNYSQKFADIASTKEYITLKTFQQESLTSLAKNLFNKFNINANTFKQQDSPYISKLLFIIIGCLVKDHGFNETLTALNPLLEELTLSQFTGNSSSSSSTPGNTKPAVGLDILSAVSLQIDQESQNKTESPSNQNNLFTQLNNNSIKLPQPQRRPDTPSTTLTLPIPTPSSSVPTRSSSAIAVKPDVSVIDNILSRINQRNTSQEQEGDKKRHLFKDGNLPHPIAQSLS